MLGMPLSILPPPIKPPVKNTLSAGFIALIARLAAAALQPVKSAGVSPHRTGTRGSARTFDLRALHAVQAFERFVRFGRGPEDFRGSSGWKGARTRRDRWEEGDVIIMLAPGWLKGGCG